MKILNFIILFWIIKVPRGVIYNKLYKMYVFIIFWNHFKSKLISKVSTNNKNWKRKEEEWKKKGTTKLGRSPTAAPTKPTECSWSSSTWNTYRICSAMAVSSHLFHSSSRPFYASNWFSINTKITLHSTANAVHWRPSPDLPPHSIQKWTERVRSCHFVSSIPFILTLSLDWDTCLYDV